MLDEETLNETTKICGGCGIEKVIATVCRIRNDIFYAVRVSACVNCGNRYWTIGRLAGNVVLKNATRRTMRNTARAKKEKAEL